ncbi:ribonuclease PH [soil metagenome]
MRPDGRQPDQLRPVTLEVGFSKFAEGSCLIRQGETHMLVTATVEDGVPRFLKGKGQGWLTSDYAMLPRSGRDRNQRDTMKPNGRSMEISRLIGRCLRTAVNLDALGERTIYIDCDALQADGGTRCASITAGYVALAQAIHWMNEQRMLRKDPLNEPVAAVSVGVHRGTPVLDLNYAEDSTAQTDMNIVLTESGKFVEIQGTAEEDPFSFQVMLDMIKLAKKGTDELVRLQKEAIAGL